MNDLERAEKRITEAVLSTLMAQWRALGGGAAGQPARSVVDPEALLLTSLALAAKEARLTIIAEDWVRSGARYLSTQRLKNLRKSLRGVEEGALADLAQVAVEDAGDGRWKGLRRMSSQRRVRETTVRRRTAKLRFQDNPALMLQLRAAFGVGVKADLMAFLLSYPALASASVTTRAIAASQPTVFRALQNLTMCGFVEPVERSAATEYRVGRAGWLQVLGYTDFVEWRPWNDIFGFTLALREQVREMTGRPVSEYAAATTLRSLAEDWLARMARAGMDVELRPPQAPNAEGTLGFVRAFEQMIRVWT